MDSSGNGSSQGGAGKTTAQPGGEYSELRGLLLGPEQDELAKLRERLDDPRVHAEEMSRVLPHAIALSASHGDHLGRALQPTVEQAVRVSVRKDSRVLVDALFPLMGPAIRKAIAAALRGMVESLDKVLRQSFSIEGLRWRLEALRSGRSFAEVALAHSLVYRVEQVFLIHKQTGLLLQHVVADHVAIQDGDMVSGMLTAIQDFVKDSFSVQEGSELETLQVGALTVIVEQGPFAVLAAVVRGSAPREFRTVLAETMESIHSRQSETLEAFSGDAAPFETEREVLESCLQARYQAEARKTSPAFWAVAAVILLAIAVWGFFDIRDGMRWARYLDRLKTEEGLVITSARRSGGRHYVTGLRDPLAADPDKISVEMGLNSGDLIGRWEPYQSLQPKFVLERANRLLQPPETVSLRMSGSSITASGVAPRDWIREANMLAGALPGLSLFDAGGLQEMEKKLDEGIRDAESSAVRFKFRTTELLPGASNDLNRILAILQTIDRYARVLGRCLDIGVSGHADSSGLETTNSRLSLERAVEIQKRIAALGLKASTTHAEGRGTRQPLRPELTEEDRSFNRSVSIRIIVKDHAS